MRDNPIQFAVVREDPLVEAGVIDESGGRRLLMTASGGCTALTLQCLYPDLQMTLFDMNTAQIELVKRKIACLSSAPGVDHWTRFNVGDPSALGLNQCGNFESLFRSFRHFIEEFVASPEALRTFFDDPTICPRALLFDSAYWPVAFDLFFSDRLLVSMFGPDAVQHATPGSYPGYFRGVLERGLRAEDRVHNYFLHHIFLGHYKDEAASLPTYLTQTVPPLQLSFDQSTLLDLESFGGFDVISLSNITDWMSPSKVETLVDRLCQTADPGTYMIFRQLNNDLDIDGLFGARATVHHRLASDLHRRDRSLFYDRILIAQKV